MFYQRHRHTLWAIGLLILAALTLLVGVAWAQQNDPPPLAPVSWWLDPKSVAAIVATIFAGGGGYMARRQIGQISTAAFSALSNGAHETESARRVRIAIGLPLDPTEPAPGKGLIVTVADLEERLVTVEADLAGLRSVLGYRMDILDGKLVIVGRAAHAAVAGINKLLGEPPPPDIVPSTPLPPLPGR